MECVFASEINEELRQLYNHNYGLLPSGDITKIDVQSIPEHDILCAGFPCQPFSIAGMKKGEQCPISGTLINNVIKIVECHSPRAFILENVPNLSSIDGGRFWNRMRNSFEKLSYDITYKVISPLEIGVPQNRERLFIVGIRDKQVFRNYEWPNNQETDVYRKSFSMADWLDEPSDSTTRVNKEKKDLIKLWWELLSNVSIPNIPSVSIVAPEFGATYPINLNGLPLRDISQYRGSYGAKIPKVQRWSDVYSSLPSYMQGKRIAPDWIYKSIEFSRNLYNNNRKFLNDWKKSIPKQYNSWQILEWRGGNTCLSVGKYIIQFRASGVRIHKNDHFPALVAMTTTQTPIIGSKMRYLSMREAAKLQGLENISLPDNNIRAFKALGNAVNAKIVFLIAQNLKHAIEESK